MIEVKAKSLLPGNVFFFEDAMYFCLSSLRLRHTLYIVAVDISSKVIKDFDFIDSVLIESDCKVRVCYER